MLRHQHDLFVGQVEDPHGGITCGGLHGFMDGWCQQQDVLLWMRMVSLIDRQMEDLQLGMIDPNNLQRGGVVLPWIGFGC